MDENWNLFVDWVALKKQRAFVGKVFFEVLVWYALEFYVWDSVDCQYFIENIRCYLGNITITPETCSYLNTGNQMLLIITSSAYNRT
uniref:Uncharacterized protein n=1 Tax=Salix viminalis TaxID=40686 RepID=A0A6N2MVH7_SALVM